MAQNFMANDVFSGELATLYPVAFVYQSNYRQENHDCRVVLIGSAVPHVQYQLWRHEAPPTAIAFAEPREIFETKPLLLNGGVATYATVCSLGTNPCNKQTCLDIVGGIICPAGQAVAFLKLNGKFIFHSNSLSPYLLNTHEEDQDSKLIGSTPAEDCTLPLEVGLPYPTQIIGRNGNLAFGVFVVESFGNTLKSGSGYISCVHGSNWTHSFGNLDLYWNGESIGQVHV